MDPRVLQIAADAATLAERLGPDWQADEGAATHPVARARLARWRDRVAPGNEESFARRLGWIGADLTDLTARLGSGSFATLPEWTGFFYVAMGQQDAGFVEAEAHPFGPVLAGFAAECVARLPAAYGAAFGPDAASTLIHDLFTKLGQLAAPALQIEFAAFRGATAGDGDTRFRAFVAHMGAGGLWDFFAEYTALARLLSIAGAQWVAHVGALAEDFLADRAAIAETFGGAAPDRIVAIDPSLSDAHNEGRSVAIVTLSTGRRLAYKPRSVGIEAAWFALLAALDGTAGSFRSLLVLDRGNRGWVEIAEHRPCRDAHEAQGYYRRAGNLLALLYALEASDCFHENVVAEGGFPILIDMETLMHPVIRPAATGGAATTMAEDMLFDSVLRAGLLPVWETGRDGVVIDISGLGAHAQQVTPYLRRRWRDINRDAMTLEHEAIVVDSIHHLPMLDGAALHVGDHVAPVIEGFVHTYQALIARRDALLAPGGLLAVMGGEMLRLVFHPTRLYGLMLKRLATPKAMRSGVERSIEFEVMARFYVNAPAKLPFHALLGAELAALERGDIPYFALPANAADLPVPGGTPIAGAFAQTAIARVAARLGRFDAADLALQTEFVRASLVMAVASAHSAPTTDDHASIDVPPATPEQMLGAALRIGETLRARAIAAADGSVTWIAPQILAHTSRYELRPLRLDLYGGQAGVALFLAALARVTGTGAELAHAALAPLRRGNLPGTLPQLLAGGHTIGGATGLGSIVYVLTLCARLLEAPELLDDALHAAALLDAGAIAADVEHDVMAGAAGAALGLLGLYDATGAPEILRTACLCGDHLLARAQTMGVGIGWPSGRHPPTTGMSHGAAGIALALARLAERSGDERYGDAADAALAFEAWMFDPDRGNWRDLRDGVDAPPSFMNAWCHGALGLGLARAALPESFISPARNADIAAAVALDAGISLGAKDGLCCGNMARTELLSRGGDADTAKAIAGRILYRAEMRGEFVLSGTNGPDFFDPSFFQGLSGIGYQLLRLCAPDLLPTVLTWD